MKRKFIPRKHGSDLPLTQEGRIVEDVDYILENPDMVKKSVVPKDMGALFDIADQIIPGAKALKDPIEKTVHHLIPILKVRKSPPNYKHPWRIVFKAVHVYVFSYASSSSLHPCQ